MNQRGMYFKSAFSLHRSLCSKVCHIFKRLDELRPAIRVAAVIHRVRADKNVCRPQDFRPSQGKGEKNRVPGRNVSDRDTSSLPRFPTFLRYCKLGCQRGTSDVPEIEIYDKMLFDIESFGDPAGRFQFYFVSLPIIKAQCVNFKTLIFCNGKRCRRVNPSA
jgi:hypothetical protein